MTNYNDGEWHGWNGGECPVHPETVVQIKYLAAEDKRKGTRIDGDVLAENLAWWHDGEDDDIIAFRVIKEHKEPREFWLLGDYRFYSMEDAEEELRKWGIDEEIIHVREVLK